MELCGAGTALPCRTRVSAAAASSQPQQDAESEGAPREGMSPGGSTPRVAPEAGHAGAAGGAGGWAWAACPAPAAHWYLRVSVAPPPPT